MEKERQEYLQESQRIALLIKTREALSKLNLNKLNIEELQALYDYIKTREALSKLNLNKLNIKELQALYDYIKYGND